MNKPVKIIVIIFLAAVFLLSLPYLFTFINGAIIGSYEWYPRPEDIAAKRMTYIFVLALILAVDTIVGIGLIKLVKSLRSK